MMERTGPVHPTRRYLDKLHSIRNIPKILAIEWGENEIEDWKNYARAARYGSSVVKQQETLALNKVVMVALEEMVPAINIANHMSHPRNRDIVVHTFKILYKSGERFYARDVKSWLVSHGGWNPIDAQEAAEIAENIQSGKRRYMTSYLSNYWYPNAIDKWRQKAENREPNQA